MFGPGQLYSRETNPDLTVLNTEGAYKSLHAPMDFPHTHTTPWRSLFFACCLQAAPQYSKDPDALYTCTLQLVNGKVSLNFGGKSNTFQLVAKCIF